MIHRILVALLLVFATSADVLAQQWATKMFKSTSHDFGSVAAGAKAEFVFEFQNIYQEDIHVLSVRSSCGCTSPTVTKATLKTWETSSVVASFNTRTFRGQRSATVTVVFDKPFYAEVQLTVTGFIRGDLVFDPGDVNFGDVELSNTAQRKVQVQYAGRNDWKIVDVRSANKHLEVELLEASRSRGRVVYDMLVRLKPDALAGHFQDQLSIVTNDSQQKTTAIMVQGNILTPVTVSPSSLFLGILQPGQTVTKNLVVKAKEPFQVECIDCGESDTLQFKAPDTDEKRNVYVIPVTFTAGNDPGQFSQKITIKTSFGGGAECCCIATATIRKPAADKN